MSKPKPKKKYKSHKKAADKARKRAVDGRTYPLKPDGTTADTKKVIWTEEVVLSELEEMLKEIRADEGIIYIGQLFIKRDYSRKYVARWREQYKNSEAICSAMDQIEEILEARVAIGGLKGTYNANFTKFHMINNHDWKDKSEVDNTHRIPTLSDIFDAATKKREKEEEEGEE